MEGSNAPSVRLAAAIVVVVICLFGTTAVSLSLLWIPLSYSQCLYIQPHTYMYDAAAVPLEHNHTTAYDTRRHTPVIVHWSSQCLSPDVFSVGGGYLV